MELGGPSIQDFADDPFWKLPNTYPFLRLDLRQSYNSDGTSSFAYQYNPPSPAQFALSVANLFTAYQDAYGPIFQAIGKPLRYAMLMVGPDADSGDCPIRIGTEPRDIWRGQRPWRLPSAPFGGRIPGRMRRNATMRGVPAIPGCDNSFAPTLTSFFHVEGRRRTREWAVPAFAAARAALDGLASPAVPEFLVTDLEGWPRGYPRGYPYLGPGVAPYFGPIYSGWFDQVIRQMDVQPHLREYLVDGDLTVEEWMAQRLTDLEGNPIPAHDPKYVGTNPAENDLYQRMLALDQASYTKSLNVGLFDPATAAFGDQLKCGQILYITNGRVSPTEGRPGLYFYIRNGQIGLGVQCGGGFLGTPLANDTILPPGDTDQRWNYYPYWVGRLQMAGMSATEQFLRWQLETFSAADWGSAQSSGTPLFPLSSVDELLSFGYYDQYKALMTEHLTRAVVAGTRNVWMFEPEFNKATTLGSLVRTSIFEQVSNLNNRITAMSQRRNRTPRAGHVSFPYLTVNRP